MNWQVKKVHSQRAKDGKVTVACLIEGDDWLEGGEKLALVLPPKACPLSARELQVLEMLGEGLKYKQIALHFRLSVSTIRTHLHNIYGKIGVQDRAHAVIMAHANGWIEVEL